MRASRNTCTTIWALACLGGTALSFSHCGVEALPPHFPLSSPDGMPAATFHCAATTSDAKPPALAAPVPFDAEMIHWRERAGAFADGQPIVLPSIRAQDVVLQRSREQRSLLSESAARRASALVPIGGDYWFDTPYPIGVASSAPWVSSAFRAGASGPLADRRSDELTGEIWSDSFALDASYLRVFVGGDSDSAVGIELLVGPHDGKDLSKCEAPAPSAAGKRPKSAAGFVVARVLRSAAVAPESRGEQLRPVDVPLDGPACDVRGVPAIVHVFDESRTAHINVGAISLADTPLTPSEKDATPVWGLADFHTHPTDYLSFGGLQGIHTIWGAPGGSMREYVGNPATARRSFARDIPSCDDASLSFNGHQGGLAAPIMINSAEGRLAPSPADLGMGRLAFSHASTGGPSFADFPDFRAGAHEQYHISQIYRAYLGGLRLMSALAVHNRGFEYGAGWVRCGDNGNPTVDTTSDWTIIRAHARAMKQLAQLNRDWMEIAYSPADARRIIQDNKLAVVLGVEVPQLGMDADGSPAEQVRNLDALGIRQVILVHGMDNLLGGTAVFEDLYNTVNDWMYRPERYRDKVETLSGLTVWKQYPASFFEITKDPSPPVLSLPADEKIEPTEGILFRLSNPERVVLSDIYPRPPSYPFLGYRFGDMHALVSTTPLFTKSQGLYDKIVGSHRNVRGLSGRGGEFIQRLMQRGMLVDLSHMSDATLAQSYDVTADACGSYPLMISHAHFRPLALKVDYSDLAADFVNTTSALVRADLEGQVAPMNACIENHARCNPAVLEQARSYARGRAPGTTNRENLPREFDIASSEIQQVRVRRGVIGVFLGQGALDASTFGPGSLPDGIGKLPIALDCAGSSQGLGAVLLFAHARMKGLGGVGVASDFTLTGSTAPRFGDNACAGYLGAGASSASGAQLLETLLDPDQYRFAQQKDAVNYASDTVATCTQGTAKRPDVPCGSNAPLDPSVMGDRTFDFNLDGLAHYGLIPDMLQDVANQLHEGRHIAFTDVFGAANAYIDMWSKARKLSRCESNGLCTEPDEPPDPQCTGAALVGDRPECGDSCPCSWNRGAPLHQIQEVMGACDPGKRITLPVVDPRGAEPTELKYQQRRADPSKPGGLDWQGDWAVYRIQKGQTWKCGDDGPRPVGCPDATSYVKVRRVLDTTVSRFTDRCDYQPLPPEDGNRRVVFQCLVGPDVARGGKP